MKKRFGSILLAFAMALTLLPWTAIPASAGEKEPEILEHTTRQRLRNGEEVNQILAYWWQLAAGRFSPGKTDAFVREIKTERLDMLCDLIANSRHEMLCLNDSPDEIDFEAAQKRLDAAFASLFPEKSSFEL